jgi:hypothetical protein
MIFIISTISTILFMFLLSTYQTSKPRYIVKKKWNKRNLNYNCGHLSYIVIIENKSSKLYCINISKLFNSKEKTFNSSHNWSFLLHCTPIFWNHPLEHHAKPAITKGHQELQNKNLTHLPPWHYSHKRNTTSFPLPLTCIKTNNPAHRHQKEENSIRALHQLPTLLSLYAFIYLFHFSSIACSSRQKPHPTPFHPIVWYTYTIYLTA